MELINENKIKCSSIGFAILIRYFLFSMTLNNILFSQEIKDVYLRNNSVKIDGKTSENDIRGIDLLKYQTFFFGEDHSSEYGPYKEISIIKLLLQNVHNIFIEYPIGYNHTVQTYLNRPPIDTTTKDFEFYSGYNKGQEILLRYIYRENQNKNDSIKLRLFHIDMISVNNVNIEDMLWFFNRKFKPKPVKEGFRYLEKIKNNNIENEDSLIKNYLLFRKSFYNSLSSYNKYLKKNFAEVKNDIDGIYVYSLARKEDTICACRSVAREEFMLKNIMEKIKEDQIENFIVINGAFHIPLTIQYGWEHMDKWDPLAAKFKRSNPNKEVCSIYFMDRKIDDYEEKYFSSERKLILENTRPGETYLIRLDGENTPFKELSEKFKYIVVW